MKKNVGSVDRWIRIILGLAIIAAGYKVMLWWVSLIGIVVLLTGLIGWCALYALFGISTVAKKAAPKKAKKAKAKKKK